MQQRNTIPDFEWCMSWQETDDTTPNNKKIKNFLKDNKMEFSRNSVRGCGCGCGVCVWVCERESYVIKHIHGSCTLRFVKSIHLFLKTI